MDVWTPRAVEKVTKTQFTAGGVRFRKNGYEVAGSRIAEMDGDIRDRYQGTSIHATPASAVAEHRESLSVIYKAVKMIDRRGFDLFKIKNVRVAEKIAAQVVSAHESYLVEIAKAKGV